jgi:hypothetical protein
VYVVRTKASPLMAAVAVLAKPAIVAA